MRREKLRFKRQQLENIEYWLGQGVTGGQPPSSAFMIAMPAGMRNVFDLSVC